MDSSFFEQTYWGLPVANYAWFTGIMLFAFLLRRPLSKFISTSACKIADKYTDKDHGPMFRDLVRKPMQMFLQAILYFIAVNQLSPLPDRITVFYRERDGKAPIDVRLGSIIDHLFLMLIIISGTMVLARIIDFVYRVNKQRAIDTRNVSRQQLLPLVKDVVKLLLWVTSVFWILGAVFQVNIPALIAGLGIGGIAIALAAKESVENLFAAFTILTDKPFQVGDTIKLGSFEGNVERIGFRATRIRSGNGAAYIIPNKKLVNENLENLSERDTSGVKMQINLKYGIPYEDLQQMTAELKEMVQKTTHVKQPVEVIIEGFGENVFQLQISYNLPHPVGAGTSATEIKQQVNMQAYAIISKYSGNQQVELRSKTEEESPEEQDDMQENKDSII
ncbi:MAG TPA: mechanosensitive ion channel family protein [Flavipsychrobacter sp.]|nr:mechanosensitive ion channel family protein [Flavipsychrobacter sp.]